MPVIYSTASSPTVFNFFKKDARGPQESQASIEIKGGAGVQHKKNFETPYGVATVVTAEELKQLQTHHVFKRMTDEGFLHVDEKLNKKPSEEDIQEVVDEELTERDKGAQDTAEDYAKKGAKAPKTDKE